MLKWGLIAAGGAIGSVLRYAIQGYVQRFTSESFPTGTLVVNVLGCLIVGFVASFLGTTLVREEYRLGLMIGVLGGFTTFSTFGLETFHLAKEGQFRLAVLNVTLSCVCGFLAVWIGYRLAERIFGASS